MTRDIPERVQSADGPDGRRAELVDEGVGTNEGTATVDTGHGHSGIPPEQRPLHLVNQPRWEIVAILPVPNAISMSQAE